MADGDSRRMYDHDWVAAETAYTQAIALNPSYESAHRGYAMLLSSLGWVAGQLGSWVAG